MQVVQGDARPGPSINGRGSQESWLGKARSFSFPGAQSQPGPEEPLQAAHPAPAAVLSRRRHSLGFGPGPEASLDHTQPFCFIIIRIRGKLFLVP